MYTPEETLIDAPAVHPTIRCMNTAEHVETLAAHQLCNWVRAELAAWTQPADMDAATVAVLLRALEFSTPGLTPSARAALMEGGEE